MSTSSGEQGRSSEALALVFLTAGQAGEQEGPEFCLPRIFSPTEIMGDAVQKFRPVLLGNAIFA
jgi:hypothetical protein